MRWIANIYDPDGPDSDHHVAYFLHDGMREAEEFYTGWIQKRTLGAPQATETRTIAELEDQGKVGIYEKEKSHE